MKLLAFESSAKAASAALLQDGVLLAEYFQNSGQTHSRTLTKMAEALLRGCDVPVQALDAVAAAAGPGSFTGVRIGLAAAKGLAWALEKPLVGVSTLEAMAWSAACSDGIYECCMDARRNQIYHARFRVRDGQVGRMTEDRAISMEELSEEIKKLETSVFLLGDGAQLCYNSLNACLPGLRLAPEHLRQQRASGVALCAARQLAAGAAADARTLAPNYLRLSQAERERMEKQTVQSGT